MVYLYAGLGVAMLAGIMAIFEMGLSLTGRSLLPIPADAYQENLPVKASDRQLLRLLSSAADLSSGEADADLCEAVRQVYELSPNQDPWVDDTQRMSELNGFWFSSCVMRSGAHRVLIRPSTVPGQPPYQLFSCITTDLCSFESSGGSE